jgi:hypothetical protein
MTALVPFFIRGARIMWVIVGGITLVIFLVLAVLRALSDDGNDYERGEE